MRQPTAAALGDSSSPDRTHDLQVVWNSGGIVETIPPVFTLRSELNCSSLQQIDQHALNTTAAHANALIC